jgi:SAM-dependent methyltransferase
MNNISSTVTIAPSPVLGHSEEYFGPYRDFWWNRDFLELMARRWQLDRYQSLLDVGCGQCHWSRLLTPYLATPANITAIDSDPKWAKGSEALAKDFATLDATLELRQGEAHRLPFADASFDVVTCQTVLIHVRDPIAALREMVRVVKPGGAVICVEPCNLASTTFVSAPTEDISIDERCDDYRYLLLCEKGKIAAGEGDSSLGSKLAHLFHLVGLDNVQSYLSDKAHPLLPPYEGEESSVCIAEIVDGLGNERTKLSHQQDDRWIAALKDTGAKDFVEQYRRHNAHYVKTLPAMIKSGTFWDSGAAVMYLVSATK